MEHARYAKYDRHHPRGRQEKTLTAGPLLRELLILTFTWRKYKCVTVIDTFSEVAMAYQVQEQSSEAVLRALQRCFQFYNGFKFYSGREFNNRKIREEMKTLNVLWHLNTHPEQRRYSEVTQHYQR